MTNGVPWYNRNRKPEQRIHEEFTEKAANRISFAVAEVASKGEIKTAYREFRIETGEDVSYFQIESPESAKQSLYRFVRDEETDYALTLLELLLNELWTHASHPNEEHSATSLTELDEKLRRILVEEGILLRLKPEQEVIVDHAGMREKRGEITEQLMRQKPIFNLEPIKQFSIRFERLANESVIEADQALRALGKQERWEDELTPYNKAWEQYQNQQFSQILPEKLYNSLEAVLEKMCVEEQGWNEQSDSVGSYLNSLKDHGLFEPNEAMIGEWQQIVGGLQVGVQRTGGDRKRHGDIDQDYCILLLHQVGAFLTFIINRYENQYYE
ncbi:hypothetical protein ACLI4Q_10955 [Natrialbaceae archaeon A-CW1-1]